MERNAARPDRLLKVKAFGGFNFAPRNRAPTWKERVSVVAGTPQPAPLLQANPQVPTT